MISFELVSDGVFDCMAGDDEGYDNLYVLTRAFMTKRAMFLHHTAHTSATTTLFVAIILTSTMIILSTTDSLMVNMIFVLR